MTEESNNEPKNAFRAKAEASVARIIKEEKEDGDRLKRLDYYLYAGDIPVCFLVGHDEGHGSWPANGRYSACWPGEEQGSLAHNPRMMSKFGEDEDEFVKIGEEEFRQRLADYVPRKVTLSDESRRSYEKYLAEQREKYQEIMKGRS